MTQTQDLTEVTIIKSIYTGFDSCNNQINKISFYYSSAVSTFSPVGLRSSDCMRVCVCVSQCVWVRACVRACVHACVCVCGRNELNVHATLAYPRISSFRVMYTITRTGRILKPFEDSEPTGRKVDIAYCMAAANEPRGQSDQPGSVSRAGVGSVGDGD